jgi:hypothetical protein
MINVKIRLKFSFIFFIPKLSVENMLLLFSKYVTYVF